MNRKEFKEKFPNLEIGDIIIKDYESSELRETPILIGFEIITNEIKIIYLDVFGASAINVYPLSVDVINRALNSNHKITKIKTTGFNF